MVYWSRSNCNLLNLILPSSLIIFPPSSVFSSVSILDFNILSMHLYIELLMFLFCILNFLLSIASSDSSSPSSSLLEVILILFYLRLRSLEFLFWLLISFCSRGLSSFIQLAWLLHEDEKVDNWNWCSLIRVEFQVQKSCISNDSRISCNNDTRIRWSVNMLYNLLLKVVPIFQFL